jgi:hypothetical protein
MSMNVQYTMGLSRCRIDRKQLGKWGNRAQFCGFLRVAEYLFRDRAVVGRAWTPCDTVHKSQFATLTVS